MKVFAIAMLLSGAFLMGCIGESKLIIEGGGASFPFPLIEEWIVGFNEETGIKVNYQAEGSGWGISQLADKNVDFAGSDKPLDDAERKSVTNDGKLKVFHLPETMGGVVVVYRLDGLEGKTLDLNGSVIAKIFKGEITRWNHRNMCDLNPELTLPGKEIRVRHRSGGSGTTFVFTSFMHKVAPAIWPGNDVDKSPDVFLLPNGNDVGTGHKGNQGVAEAIKSEDGSIGYVELAYADSYELARATIYGMEANTSSIRAAAVGVMLPPADGNWEGTDILNVAGAYPIVTFTYLLVYKELSTIKGMNEDKAKALVRFLLYIMDDKAQDIAAGKGYAPLPREVTGQNVEAIKSITYNGENVYEGLMNDELVAG